MLNLQYLPWLVGERECQVLSRSAVSSLEVLERMRGEDRNFAIFDLLLRVWGSTRAPAQKLSGALVKMLSNTKLRWWDVVATPRSHVEWMSRGMIDYVLGTPDLWNMLDVAALSSAQKKELLQPHPELNRDGPLSAVFTSEKAYPYLSQVLDCTKEGGVYRDRMEQLAHMTRASWVYGEWERLMGHLSAPALQGLMKGTPSVAGPDGERIQVQVRACDMRSAVAQLDARNIVTRYVANEWGAFLETMNEESGRELLRILPGLASVVTPEHPMFSSWAGEEIYTRLREAGASLAIGVEMVEAHPELCLEEICALVRRLSC